MSSMDEKDKASESHVGSGSGQDVSPWRLFFSVLFTPVQGHKRLKNSKLDPAVMVSRVYYPVLALVSAAAFMDLAYGLDNDISSILQNAVALFVSFFITYFALFPAAGGLLGKNVSEKLASGYGRRLVSVTLTVLALNFLLYELCPVLEPVLFFAPVYTIYLITRGVKFLRLDDKRNTACIMVIVLLEIGLPYLIYWCLKAFLQINM